LTVPASNFRRLFLIVEVRDHALGPQIQDIRDYSAADILFDQRFVDAVTVDDGGRTMAGLGRICLVESDEQRRGRDCVFRNGVFRPGISRAVSGSTTRRDRPSYTQTRFLAQRWGTFQGD